LGQGGLCNPNGTGILQEVAEKVGSTKKQAVQSLETLVELAYKNPKNTFTLPGLGNSQRPLKLVAELGPAAKPLVPQIRAARPREPVDQNKNSCRSSRILLDFRFHFSKAFRIPDEMGCPIQSQA
jgi:hypothetical protein